MKRSTQLFFASGGLCAVFVGSLLRIVDAYTVMRQLGLGLILILAVHAMGKAWSLKALEDAPPDRNKDPYTIR